MRAVGFFFSLFSGMGLGLVGTSLWMHWQDGIAAGAVSCLLFGAIAIVLLSQE